MEVPRPNIRVKSSRLNLIELVIICSLFLVLGFAIKGLMYEIQEKKVIKEYNEIIESLQRAELYKKIDIKNKTIINGVYYPNEKYYCVYVENREIDDIEKTDKHEYCHHLVNEQTKHFCEKKTW